MTKKSTADDIAGTIIIILLFLAILSGVAHTVIWGCHIGIPKDNPDLLIISFSTDSTAEVVVYGFDYQKTQDKYGNEVITVYNAYDVSYCHWRFSESKSWYGHLKHIEYYNPSHITQ